MTKKCYRLVLRHNGKDYPQPRRYRTEKYARKDRIKLIQVHGLIDKSPLSKEKLRLNTKNLRVEKC